jgi:hypothetical protein
VSGASPKQSLEIRGDRGLARKPSRRELRLRERAFSHLNKAIDEAGPQLSRAWVEKGDPDLRTLRDDRDWRLVTNRLGASGLESTEQSPPKKLGCYEARLPNRYPARPWGRPTVRQAVWLVLGAIFVTAAVLLGMVLLISPHAFSGVWLVVVALIALFNLWQLLKARREVILVGDEHAFLATYVSTTAPRRLWH